MSYHFTIFNLPWNNLENFLNDLENFATGAYEIVSIVSRAEVVTVIVKFTIKDPIFDEETIKKLL